MLIKCPECGKSISDKVEACPNCGAPQPAAARLMMLEERTRRIFRLLIPVVWTVLLATAILLIILFKQLFAS